MLVLVEDLGLIKLLHFMNTMFVLLLFLNFVPIIVSFVLLCSPGWIWFTDIFFILFVFPTPPKFSLI